MIGILPIKRRSLRVSQRRIRLLLDLRKFRRHQGLHQSLALGIATDQRAQPEHERTIDNRQDQQRKTIRAAERNDAEIDISQQPDQRKEQSLHFPALK